MKKGNSTKYKAPFKLVILELVGGSLIGVGLFDKLNISSRGLVPESLRFQNYQWVLITLGILSIIPELIYIWKFFKSKPKA